MKGHVHGIPLTRSCQGQPRSRNQSNKPHASYELKEKDTERFENYSSDNSCIIFTKCTYDIKILRHAINLGRKVIYAPSEDRSTLASLALDPWLCIKHKSEARSLILLYCSTNQPWSSTFAVRLESLIIHIILPCT